MSACLNQDSESWSGPHVQNSQARSRRFPTLSWTSVFSSVKWRHEANGLRRTLSPLRVFSNCAVFPARSRESRGSAGPEGPGFPAGARGRGTPSPALGVSAQAGVGDPARNEPGPPGEAPERHGLPKTPGTLCPYGRACAGGAERRFFPHRWRRSPRRGARVDEGRAPPAREAGEDFQTPYC